MAALNMLLRVLGPMTELAIRLTEQETGRRLSEEEIQEAFAELAARPPRRAQLPPEFDAPAED